MISETIIIDGDSNIEESIPAGNSTSIDLGIDRSDFEKLVELTQSLQESQRLLREQNSFLIAKENGTNKKIESYESTLKEITETNTRLSTRIDKLETDNNELTDQNEILRNRSMLYSTIFWVALLFSILVTFQITKIYYIFSTRGKTYWLVEYLRNLWPFRTAPPDPDDVKFKLMGKPTSTYGWLFILGILTIIAIATIVIIYTGK